MAVLLFCASGWADELVVPESSLLRQYEASRQLPQQRDFPFHINSREQGDALAADVLMEIPVAYADFRDKLSHPRHWCDFLILHLNIKSCVMQRKRGQDMLVLYAGRKQYQPPEITYKLQYRFRLVDNREGYFEVLMDAPNGPLYTSDYRIHVRAIPYGTHTVVALALNYTQSYVSRAATYSYLNTLGRDKVGFSLLSADNSEEKEYVGGVKGVIERNVMRYFLALKVYLQAQPSAPANGFRQMAVAWFEDTERYQRQLHEYEQEDYLQAKLKEYVNQQALQNEIDRKSGGNHPPAG